MTGGEIMAAKAAASVAKAAKGGDVAKAELVAAATNTPGFERAAQLYGQRQAARQQLALNLFRPLARLLGVGKEYFDGQFAADMAEQLTDVPEEHLTTPIASVAMPALQGLTWSLDEPNLKAMYIRLLATAADDRHASDAHPAFAEIIKQLSAPEALALRILRLQEGRPAAKVRLWLQLDTPDEGFVDAASHLIQYDDPEGQPVLEIRMPAWIDNWVRLGLIDVSYNINVVGADRYAWVESRPEVLRVRELYDSDEYRIEIAKGRIDLTSFGEMFMRAVVEETSSDESEDADGSR